MATYQMGPDTYAVPMTLFRDNRIRVAKAVKNAQPALDEQAFIVLQGGVDIPFNDTDIDHVFRQVINLITSSGSSKSLGFIYKIYTFRSLSSNICLA